MWGGASEKAPLRQVSGAPLAWDAVAAARVPPVVAGRWVGLRPIAESLFGDAASAAIGRKPER